MEPKLSQPRVWILVFFAALLTGLGGGAQAPARETIRLGKVTIKRTTTRKRFVAFCGYLESKGYEVAAIRTPGTIEEMVDLVRKGEVNLVFESPYGSIRMMDGCKLEPLLLREKDGVKDYSSVLFVPRSSAVRKLEDLVGKVIVFEDQSSTASYHLPKTILEDKGFKLVQSRVPVTGAIAYWFSLDDLRSIRLVAEDTRVAGGGIDKRKLEGDDRFRMIGPESNKVPRHVVLAGPGIDKARLSRILLGMKADEEAKEALVQMLTPTGFSKLPGEAREYMDREVRKLLGLARKEVGRHEDRKDPGTGPGR